MTEVRMSEDINKTKQRGNYGVSPHPSLTVVHMSEGTNKTKPWGNYSVSPRPSLTELRTCEDIKNVVRRVRAELYMSQAEFADEMGVSQQMVSCWERGIHPPSIPSFLQMTALVNLKIKIEDYEN